MKARVFPLALAALTAPLLVASAPAAPSASGSGLAWLHVRVEEARKESTVRVNLPLNVVEAALKFAPETVVSHGRVHLGPNGKHLEIADLRQLWKELKTAGDSEIVSVEEKDEHVNVSRKGDLLMIRVEKDGRRDAVHVDVPVAMVDALLAGSEGNELDIRAGIAELRKLRGDIVRVNDNDTTVRVWIDENAAGPHGGK